MELLILLVQRRGELVSREEIADRLWGKDIFVDIDHSINTAIRKIRLVLRDDPEKPHYVETVVGKGYRFAASVTYNNGVFNASSETRSKEQSPAPQAQTIAEPAPLATRKRLLPLRRIALIGFIAAAAIITVALMLNRTRATGNSLPAIRSLAVLPLKNLSGDPTQEY